MPLLFLGFFFMMLVWLFWAVAWVVVWAVVMLAWPLAFLLAGVMLWRGLMRRSQHSVGSARSAGGSQRRFPQQRLRGLSPGDDDPPR